MAPGPKRKRGDRTYSQDDDRNARPSPHRPQNLTLGHHGQYQSNSPRGGGSRRASRGGPRGGSSVPHSPSISHASPTTMSPPINPSPTPKQPQATSSNSNPTPPTAQATPASRPPLVSESNDYLTPERAAHWGPNARDAVVQAAVTAQRDGDIFTLSIIFHEIIEAALDRAMDSGVLGGMVRDIVAAPADEMVDPVATFLDTLSSLTQDKDKQAFVRQMLVATQIQPTRMRNELENELLISLGLVRDSFTKMAVRKATHALYRQSNYNLLREETEGYSKLMTEYFTTVNNQPPTQEVVSETYQRVNALIGAFDLDIGRVLDVTLDVFANLLVKHGKFFVKFLRSSAWWPELRGFEGIEWQEPDVSALPRWAQPDSPLWHYTEEEKDEQLQLREQRDRKFWERVGQLGDRAGIGAFFELGGRRIMANNRQPDQTMPAEGQPLSKQQAARKWADEWMKQTKTLPPSGNDIAAQLLGFKLRFYASDTRDSNDFLPDNLIYLAALLIKIGFISILDLYPHLYPLEEDMPAHKEKVLKAKKEKEQKEKGGVVNALTMAGALPDDTLPPVISRLREAEGRSKSDSERSTPSKTDETSDKKTLPEPADQKFQLLKSLLCIGALPEALFILGRHAWMLDAYPELLKLIFRLAHHSLSKVYESARPASAEQIPMVAKGASLRTPSRPSDYIPRRTLRWAKPDERDAGDGIDYKFYWEDWVDNVPVCQEVDDVIKLCNTLLGMVGPECGQDIVLLTKIVRIGKQSLANDSSVANRKRWINFSATFIAPALSFTGRNPGIINEVWDLFKQFDIATRYTIYQQWFSGNKPAIRAVFAEVQSQTKHELSRISATNTKEYGRKIAKVSYSSPGIVFQMTVKQLVAYPNMIDALVECSRYLTLLGYDCLTWTLVRFFLNPDKGSTQDDGMLSAPWLKNIASFVGKAYQKYYLMDPTPILQFTTHQLLRSEGGLYMLDVLEQMIKSMGGIGLSGSISESMTLALCGGTTLRTFTLQHHLSDNRHNAGSSAKRLVKCLKDAGLAPQILIALAQHVEAYVHREDQQETPDKVVLFNVDKLRSNLIQYLELLRAYLTAAEFDDLFPSLIEMMSEFGVEPDVAFTVARASIAAKATAWRVARRAALAGSKTQVNGDVTMSGVEETMKDSATATEDVEMQDANSSAPVEMGKGPSTDMPNPKIEALVAQLKESLPDTFAEHPCLSFYVTFWQLSLPDVDQDGINKQYRDTIAHFERQLASAIPNRGGYKNSLPRKEAEEMRRARVEVSKLKDEQKAVSRVNEATQDSLRAEMRHWFDGVPMLDSRSNALHNSLLQDCFIPRSRMSLEDAQFAASMLKFMHKSGVPGFRTIKLLDLLFNANKLTCIISMYTEDESRTFGRFLSEILRELQIWHDNKNDAYIKRAHGSEQKVPGFGKYFGADRSPTDFLKYEEFCLLLYKWHKALFTATKTCIDSGNYMQIRNAINVLNALSQSFPKVDTMANDLRQTIVELGKADERADLKTALQSLLAGFKRSEKFWLKEWEFRGQEAPVSTNGGDKATLEKRNTPQPQETRLNATVPAFKPKSEINGTQRGSTDKPDDRESQSDLRATTPSQQETGAVKPTIKPGPPMHPSSIPPRPEGRNITTQLPSVRPPLGLPTRPDPQPPRPRQPERGGNERLSEHGANNRYDNRGPPNDYGRLDRPGDSGRPREPSPGRRSRLPGGGRTPERIPQAEHREWGGRDPREFEDRNMRAPQRDMRGQPPRPHWESRDPRERPDSRGHPAPPTMEPRRMVSNSSLAHEHSSHRRDLSLNSRPGVERENHGQLRPPNSSSQAPEGPPVNPQRAALIDLEHGRHEPPRSNHDSRRDRNSRPQSPRRGENRRGDERWEDRRIEDGPPSGYHNRNEPLREHRDDRPSSQLLPSNGRDRRDEAATNTPTGPRGGRGEAPVPARASREMFQPVQNSRPSHQQVQDPNYGRLNQPGDSMPPSGPRSDRPQNQSQPPTPTAPSGPASSHPVGIHPSRLDNIQSGRGSNGPPLQTNMPIAPSGPRGSNRNSQGAIPSSPVGRGTPTGPAATDRGARNGGNPLRAINSVLTQNAPNDRPIEQNIPPSNPPVRGRGASRANGPIERSGDMTSPMLPPPYNSAPNTRMEGHYGRSNRNEGPPSIPGEDGQSEPRSHRDSRRSERSGRERSSDRSDRRPNERSIHNMGPDRPSHAEQERGSDRERGREKRGSEREGSRREREGDRSSREPGREPRESSRRERTSRDDGRSSGRDERDRRSRTSGGEDGRKRVREPTDQGQAHGDVKRRR